MAFVAVPSAKADGEFRAPSKLGAHSMLYLNHPPAVKEALFRAAARSGASFIRLDLAVGLISPSLFEPVKLELLDPIIELSKKYGIKVVPNVWTVGYGQTEECRAAIDDEFPDDPQRRDLLYGRCPPTGTLGTGQDDGDLDLEEGESTEAWFLYYGLLRTIAEYFHDHGDVVAEYEIWNEPNVETGFNRFFLGTAEDYAVMLEGMARAIRQGDPDAKIASGALVFPANQSLDADWIARAYTAETILESDPPGTTVGDLLDVIHVNVRGWLNAGAGSVTGQIAYWRSILGDIGLGDLPIRVTEHGYPSNCTGSSQPYWPCMNAFKGENGQARFLTAPTQSGNQPGSLGALTQAAPDGPGVETVFVTMRDNLWPPFDYEGVIGDPDTVSDDALTTPGWDPNSMRFKPAFKALGEFARAADPSIGATTVSLRTTKAGIEGAVTGDPGCRAEREVTLFETTDEENPAEVALLTTADDGTFAFTPAQDGFYAATIDADGVCQAAEADETPFPANHVRPSPPAPPTPPPPAPIEPAPAPSATDAIAPPATPPPPATVEIPVTPPKAVTGGTALIVRPSSSGLRATRNGQVAVRVRCPGTAACAGVAGLEGGPFQSDLRSRRGRNAAARRGGRIVQLGARRFSVRAGRTATVRIKISRKARRQLARHRRLRVRTFVRPAAGGRKVTGPFTTLRPAGRRR